MTISVPLPPHLEQFVREQVASKLFQTEGDVVYAVLRLLEDQILSPGSLPSQFKQNPDRALSYKPTEPGSKEFWDELREQLHADRVPGKQAALAPSARRSPRGLLADLRSNISPEDIKAARRELRSGSPQGEA